MKFWTADSDVLMVDMVECHQCDRWIPTKNLEIHTAAFHSQCHLPSPADNNNNIKDHPNDNIDSPCCPTLPCHDCQVLVPHANWEIHRAHGCRNRNRRQDTTNTNLPPTTLEEAHSNNDHSTAATVSFFIDTVECPFCGILVPRDNLELHQTRACLHPRRGRTTTVEPTDDPTTMDASHHTTTAEQGKDKDHGMMLDPGRAVQEWECPRCTFINPKPRSNNDSETAVLKCTLCDYSPAMASAKDDDNRKNSNHTITRQGTTSRKTHPGRSDKNRFWQTLVSEWVPPEYHAWLLPARTTTHGRPKRSRRPNHEQPKPHVPRRQDLRNKRSPHLDWVQRERQQYQQLLENTRQQYQNMLLLEEQPQEDKNINKGELEEERRDSNPLMGVFPPPPTKSHELVELPQPAPQPTQLELLQTTEHLCLYHLEHLRRTTLVQQLKLDVELLGLPRWKHHLHHLMDLYQSASERYVDHIVWELRMHFIQYATLEVMALLELALWSEQIRTLVRDVGPMEGTEARRVCRNDRDICLVCQSVLPFLGRPQTRALRTL